MAKSKLSAAFGSNFEIWDAYEENFIQKVFEKKQAVYVDYNYARIEFGGKGIKGDGDYMTAGTISSVEFIHWQKGTYLDITGLDLKATKVSHILMDQGIEAMMTYLLRGNDTIKGANTNDILKGGAGNDRISGGAGDDNLYGQAGNDTLTGNGGTDYFHLQAGGGKDTVTDFVGGLGQGHDYVHLDFGAQYDIIDNKKGAIVKLTTGETMQLLGVDADDVQIFQDYVDPNQF